MPVETEKEVAAYLQTTNKRLYDRLFLNKTIAGKITAVSGTRPLYLVRLDSTGDAWHACYEPGYTPSIGDSVDLTWRDADTGYVMTPRSSGALVASYSPIGPPVILVANIASVSFSSIPQSFQHLKLFLTGQTDNASPQPINCQLNGDGSSVYYGGYVNTTTVAGYAQNPGLGVFNVGFVPASSSLNTGTNEITFFDYTSSTHRLGMTFVTHSVEGGASGNFRTAVGGGIYAPATILPVTSIKVFPAAGNFVVGSKFCLYGI